MENVLHWVAGLAVAGLLVVAAPQIVHQATSDEGDGWSVRVLATRATLRRGVNLRTLYRRLNIISDLPAGWCCSYEAAALLLVSRSTLCRYEADGELEGRFKRVRTSSGVRMLKLFRRTQVQELAERRKESARKRMQSIAMKNKARVFVPLE